MTMSPVGNRYPPLPAGAARLAISRMWGQVDGRSVAGTETAGETGCPTWSDETLRGTVSGNTALARFGGLLRGGFPPELNRFGRAPV
jgi:hypothetical protein